MTLKTQKPVSLITGVTGQDGSYLAEILLDAGHRVIGVARRCSHKNDERIHHIKNDIEIEEADVTDASSIYHIVNKYIPDYIYNLAAQSHVHTSFIQPYYTTQTVYLGALNILEAIRFLSPYTRFYQASSSEIFGDQYTENNGETYQDENTPKNPRSPYAIAKLAAYNLTRLYRDAYGIFACNGILFNHESARRGENFVTRKITKWIGDLGRWADKNNVCLSEVKFSENYIVSKKPMSENAFPKLRLGNLDSFRDWGHSKDYCSAMKLILEHDVADDFVVGTGKTHSIRNLLEVAFNYIGIDDFSLFIIQDPKFMRPSEVPFLKSNSSKIQQTLEWTPQYSFQALIEEMVHHDINNFTG
jgi:GDPmannose 4,6-dehydratase